MKLYNNTMNLLEQAMEVRFRRHSLLSSNVANSETPNYRARDLDFRGQLEKVLNEGASDSLIKTDSKHMDVGSSEEAHIVLDNSSAMGADGNNVDLDISMGKLSENSRAYQNAVTMMGIELRMLKTAARGRSI